MEKDKLFKKAFKNLEKKLFFFFFFVLIYIKFSVSFGYIERISQNLSKYELLVINLDSMKSVISQDSL